MLKLSVLVLCAVFAVALAEIIPPDAIAANVNSRVSQKSFAHKRIKDSN